MNNLTLMFHGFPGPGNPNVKSSIYLRDAVMELSKSKGEEFLYPSYPGILAKGEFSFIGAYKSSLELLEKIQLSFEEITIIGHSFGGMCAVMCLSRLKDLSKIKKVILIAPLLDMYDRDTNKTVLENIMQVAPGVLKDDNLEGYLEEIDKLKEVFHPFSHFAKSKKLPQMELVAGTQDVTCPPSRIKEFSDIVKGNYHEVDAAHTLSQDDVSKIIELIR